MHGRLFTTKEKPKLSEELGRLSIEVTSVNLPIAHFKRQGLATHRLSRALADWLSYLDMSARRNDALLRERRMARN